MKKNPANILLITIGILIVGALGYNFYYQIILNGETETTFALITDIQKGNAVKSPAGVNYYYKVGNIRYTGSEYGNFKFMKVGDTLLIRYGVNDHSVSEVVDKHYMKKYQNK